MDLEQNLQICLDAESQLKELHSNAVKDRIKAEIAIWEAKGYTIGRRLMVYGNQYQITTFVSPHAGETYPKADKILKSRKRGKVGSIIISRFGLGEYKLI